MIPNSYINTIKYGKNWRFSKVIDKQMTNVTVTDWKPIIVDGDHRSNYKCKCVS